MEFIITTTSGGLITIMNYAGIGIIQPIIDPALLTENDLDILTENNQVIFIESS